MYAERRSSWAPASAFSRPFDVLDVGLHLEDRQRVADAVQVAVLGAAQQFHHPGDHLRLGADVGVPAQPVDSFAFFCSSERRLYMRRQP
jgi:hypothetical protein